MFTRPDVTAATYLDASGEPIAYGRRWDDFGTWVPMVWVAEKPRLTHGWRQRRALKQAQAEAVRGPEIPGEMYSTVAHPERFEPLDVMARALAEWVEREFEVRVEREVGGVGKLEALRGVDHLRGGVPVRWAALFEPGGVGGAGRDALGIVVREPAGVGVIVTLGGREAALVPMCGCDACDPDVEGLCS